MKLKICIPALMACLAVGSYASAQDLTWQEKVTGIDSNAEPVSPGLLFSDDGNSKTYYASGVDGMRFMKGYLEDLLSVTEEGANAAALKEELQRINGELSRLEGQKFKKTIGGSSFDLMASDSANLCGASYEISATAINDRFWYIEANADAGFTPHNPLLGPMPPGGTATVTTYGKITSQWGTYTDSDQETANVIGSSSPPAYVSADPVSLRVGPSASCMTAEAVASIFVEYCSDGYRAVVETFEMHCD